MTKAETVEALYSIGLRAEIRSTGHYDYERVFVIDRNEVTQGRMTILKGEYSHAKWYVSKIDSGPVLEDERLPFAWQMWIERREHLTVELWRDVVAYAKDCAERERAEKQALRITNGTKTHRRLSLNVRKYIHRTLFPVSEAQPTT